MVLSYKELYFQLFAAVTDALRDLQSGQIISAMRILLCASEAAEEIHMESDVIPEAPLE